MMRFFALWQGRVSEFAEKHDLEAEKKFLLGLIWFFVSGIVTTAAWRLMLLLRIDYERIFIGVPMIFGAATRIGHLAGMSRRSCLIWSVGPGILLFTVIGIIIGTYSHHSGDAGMADGFALGLAAILMPLAFVSCAIALGLLEIIRSISKGVRSKRT